MDIQSLKKEIAGLHDARRTAYGHIRHRLEDIVDIGLCVAICGGEDFADMETFGRERERRLRGFLELPNGIPDADTFRRVFKRLDPQELGRCLRWWLDVVFREDAVRARKDNSPLNMNVLRKTALMCLNQAKYGRISRKKMMFKAALNPEVLLDILFLRKK